MSTPSLLERAADIQERHTALKSPYRALQRFDADWTTYGIAAKDAIKIAEDGLRNA